MRILLVDDEDALRTTLAANLELDGHSVFEASDGRRAIELLHRNQVDLVLSDIRMPNLSGIGLLQFVKRNHPEVPVVLMTAYTVEEQVQIAVSEGVFTVLKKPFDLGAAVPTLTRAARAPLVLVVDDGRADAIFLTEGLRLSGVKAAPASSAEQALEAVRNGFIDVCVVDLTVTGMDGTTLVARLHEVDPLLAVIVLSGKDTREIIGRLSASSFRTCMKKPIDPRELLVEVAKLRGGPSSC